MINLIHWNSAEADAKAQHLRELGFEVHATMPRGAATLKEFSETPPDAFLIDLSRLPSQGRDFGILLRQRKATRNIPLVFIGGELEKVARVREILPDATYTTWQEIETSPHIVFGEKLEKVFVPTSVFAAYSATPLIKKLGIKPSIKVCFLEAPEGFSALLGQLPEGVELSWGVGSGCDLVIWFTRNLEGLEAMIDLMVNNLGQGVLWIAWPKKTSSIATPLNQQRVRAVGLSHGLVDNKICSIDDTWSALLFRKRQV
jgi:hypothetical protein